MQRVQCSGDGWGLPHSGEHLLGYILLFAALLFVAFGLLFVALLLFVADLVGSMMIALLLLGGLSLIAAFGLYCGCVNPRLAAIRNEVRSLYEIAAAARSGYRWVRSMIANFF